MKKKNQMEYAFVLILSFGPSVLLINHYFLLGILALMALIFLYFNNKIFIKMRINTPTLSRYIITINSFGIFSSIMLLFAPDFRVFLVIVWVALALIFAHPINIALEKIK